MACRSRSPSGCWWDADHDPRLAGNGLRDRRLRDRRPHSSGRHGDAADRASTRSIDADGDETAQDRRGRGPGRDRQLRDGADDHAAAVRAACAGLCRRRRLLGAALHRDGTDRRQGAAVAAAGVAAALCRRGRHRRADRRSAGRPAPPARRPSRHQAQQHHVPRERRGGAARFRAGLQRPAARPDAGGIPAAIRHRALHGAGTAAGRARRSAQRSVRARRAAVLLHHRRAAVRRDRDDVRHAPAAVARSECRRAN